MTMANELCTMQEKLKATADQATRTYSGADQLELGPRDIASGVQVAIHIVDCHVVRLRLEKVLVANLK